MPVLGKPKVVGAPLRPTVSHAPGICRRLLSPREQLLAKPGADVPREELKKGMQCEREKDKIINQTQKRDREVGWVQCVQAKEHGCRP
jgi:hypothetical protein